MKRLAPARAPEPVGAEADPDEPDATPADGAPTDRAPTDGARVLVQNMATPRDTGSNQARYTSTLDDTGRIPLVGSGSDVSTGSVTPPESAGNVLTRPADPTEAIPRIRPDSPSPRMADPDTNGADPDIAPADHPRTRHVWVWVGLAAFWLLALGAGLVTLASLGAPHFLCTGTASTGLACHSAGTAIAAVLTVVLIVAVGSVSVLAIEQRAQGRTAWRWLGIGVVLLVVVASCGYLLIRTIGG